MKALMFPRVLLAFAVMALFTTSAFAQRGGGNSGSGGGVKPPKDEKPPEPKVEAERTNLDKMQLDALKLLKSYHKKCYEYEKDIPAEALAVVHEKLWTVINGTHKPDRKLSDAFSLSLYGHLRAQRAADAYTIELVRQVAETLGAPEMSRETTDVCVSECIKTLDKCRMSPEERTAQLDQIKKLLADNVAKNTDKIKAREAQAKKDEEEKAKEEEKKRKDAEKKAARKSAGKGGRGGGNSGQSGPAG